MGRNHTGTVRPRARRPYRCRTRVLRMLVPFLLVAFLLGGTACGGAEDDTGGRAADRTRIGLVTKTEANPFFAEMREAAEAAAAEHDAELIALSGRSDVDNEGQVDAVESLISRGVDGILITPSSGTGVVGAIEQARQENILVIALDSPTEPADAVDATFATDNFMAGRLQGRYLRGVLGDRDPKVIMLDGPPGSTVSPRRHAGFLTGFGLKDDSPAIVGRANALTDQNETQTAVEGVVQRAGDVNIIYTINEPVARGAYEVLVERGLAGEVAIGSIDGGCGGVRDVEAGRYAATVMQFPARMAREGVTAVVDFVENGEKPSGFTNTGAVLITDEPVPGVESRSTDWGLEHCWG